LQAGQDNDLLDLASGAVVLSATTQHGGKWNAQSLLDNSTVTGWSSTKDYPNPNAFLIELPGEFLLSSFVIDNTGAEESSFPGISARHFTLYGSTTSPEEVFDLIISGQADKGERKVFRVDEPTKVRWLKLVILSNYGNPSHTQVMELEAYGEAVGDMMQATEVHGIYATNYGLMRLEQSGSYVVGCYEADNGLLSGKTNGRALNFRWWEAGPNGGTACMVLSSDGNSLNGLWYEKGQVKGIWYGGRVTDGRCPDCEVPVLNTVVRSLYEGRSTAAAEKSIMKESQARTVSGQCLDEEANFNSLPTIYFDTDSAEIKSEYVKKLQESLAVMQSYLSRKIIVTGHTDSTHTPEYNLELSLQRARSVRQWFIGQGVAANRLETRHYGESQPVADNSTPAGRTLNRRVEIVLQ
jgi:outer membrane protein OmpA-like peptidoglycan-associated protein